MKVRNFIGAMTVAGLAAAPTAALAQAAKTTATAQKTDDGTLKSRIEARLTDTAALKGSDIDVDVENGVATLTGTVQSEAQSARARTLVTNVTGVTSVNNKLTVDSKAARSADKAGDKADAAMDKAGDKSSKAMDKAADKTDRAADKSASTMQKAGQKTEKVLEKAGIRIEDDKSKTGTTGQTTAKGKDDVIDVDANINDAWITTKIKGNFVNEDALKGSEISVDTNKHVVTLKGTVTSAAGRARAVQLAKGTKGVTRVVDNLTIAPAK